MSVIPTVTQDGVGVVSAGQLNAYAFSCYNIGVLRSLVGQTGMTAYMQGTNVPNDGGQGNFYWDYTSTATDNNSTVIRPYGVIYGAWIRTIVSGAVVGDVSNATAIATGTTTARTIANFFGDSVSVKDFGAVGNGVTDDTSAIQAAITALQNTIGANSYGGGALYFPAGKYKINGTLYITNSFINLYGAGIQSTYLEFSNGASDCIVINGISVSGGIREITIRNMALNGSGKTAGATVKVQYAYQCIFQNISVEYCITGFDIGGGTNNITINNAVIVPNLAGSLHGIYWHCPIDGSTRSDVLTLDNVVVEGQWSNATCVLWSGFCNTLVGSHLRLLHAAYGLRVVNPAPSSGTYYPQFLNVFDLECEGFKNRAVSIEAGACFKIVASDINNLTGGDPSQGNADDYALAIIADNGNSYTRSIQISDTRIGLCRKSGLYNEGWDVALTNCIFVSTSFAGSGLYPVISIQSNSRDVQLSNIRGEEYGGAGLASYVVQVEASAQDIQMSSIDATYCVSGALNNLSSQPVTLLNAVEPLNSYSGWGMDGKGNNTCAGTIAGDFIVKALNRSAANSSSARFDWATGISNAYAISALHNNTGTPSWDFAVGSSVNTITFVNQTLGVALNQNATSWASLSDERLKNVTGTYDTPLEDLSKIQTVRFTWKADETKKPQVGVLAQSVLPVVPEAVDTTTKKKDGDEEYYMVRYSELIPLLISCVQELNKQVDALKNKTTGN